MIVSANVVVEYMGKMGLMRVALATVGSQALGVDGVLESGCDQKHASELE